MVLLYILFQFFCALILYKPLYQLFLSQKSSWRNNSHYHANIDPHNLNDHDNNYNDNNENNNDIFIIIFIIIIIIIINIVIISIADIK